MYMKGREKPIQIGPVGHDSNWGRPRTEFRRMLAFRKLQRRVAYIPYQSKLLKQKPMGGNELSLCTHMGFLGKEIA